MAKKALLVVLGIIALGVLVYVAYIAGSGQQTQEFFEQTTVVQCEDIKQSVCNDQGTISEEDYPDSCTQNGQHVLDNPYSCP